MQRSTYRSIFVSLFCLIIVANPPAFGHEIPDLGPRVYQPQIVATPGGGLLLVWVYRDGDGFNLFARASAGDGFAEPVQVNRPSELLHSIPIDEMRPAIALGPDNRVALAWTDSNYDIQVAISPDLAHSFGPPRRINQDTGEALQEFPNLAYGPNGVLHVAWLDPRIAEDGFEEPADLYYATMVDGKVTERNLTASQESSVCGCCLPDVTVGPDGSIIITFRNTTDTGYRDPYRVVGNAAGQFGPPEPVSPPIWQIELCPVAGPVAVDGATLWFDGSTGRNRLLSAVDPARMPEVILSESDDFFLDAPPRRVSGTPSGTPLLLVPAQPSAYLLARQGRSWSVLADDLPAWATSAAIHDGRLVLVGIDGADFRSEVRDLDFN